MSTNSRRVKRAYLLPGEAAELAGVSRQTIHAWASRYPGLGTWVAGRLRITPERLAEICEGRPAATAQTTTLTAA